MNQIDQAIKYATNNKQPLSEGGLAGCYYCLNIYPANEVVDFIEQEKTALCPKCGIDSVLPETSGYPLNKIVLQELRNFWF